jgi:hypothetical protein
MTATDAQVRLLMKERNKGKTQEQAAAKANLRSRKTVAKYEKSGKLPSEIQDPRDYRTRPDAFSAVWDEVAAMLDNAPSLEAKTLFEWLEEQYPGQYQENQIRTFQRRVRQWRGLHQDRVLSLDQVRVPGEMLQTDGTCMNELQITIQREPFDHLLIHSVLPYSNWQWGRIAQSESLLSIRLGLQSALIKLGHIPTYHQTDNSTAATHNLSAKARKKSLAERGYNEEYLQLLAHYGLKARTTHIHSPNENGDVESSNGKLKVAIDQYLLLRGSRDFESLEAYEAFLHNIMDKRNAGRATKLAEELAVMKPLDAKPWPLMREKQIKVGNNGILRVGGNGYSVPSSLMGRRVRVRIYEWQIEIWYANKLVERLPRIPGMNRYHVNYRHVIDSLLRKPGGFRNYRHRDDLFPQTPFRLAWEALNEHFSPRKADLAYLRILKLAADGQESDVAAALKLLLETEKNWDDQSVKELIHPTLQSAPAMVAQTVELSTYDQLLRQEHTYVSA